MPWFLRRVIFPVAYLGSEVEKVVLDVGRVANVFHNKCAVVVRAKVKYTLKLPKGS